VLDPIVVLQSLAAAGLIAAAVALLFALASKRRPAWSAAGMVLGVGLGLAAGCAWLGVRPHWPPREDQDRLLLVLIPAVVIVEIAATVVGKWAWSLRLALAGSAAWILLFGSSYITDLSGPGSREWSPEQTWLVLSALGAGLIVVWAALAALARRTGGRSVPLALSLACIGAGVAIVLSGYASGGQLGLPLAAAVAGVVLSSLILPIPLDTSGTTGVAVVGLFSLLVVGRFFGQLTTLHAVILFLVPVVCWLPEAPPVRRLRAGYRGFIRTALVVAPLLLVVLQAQQKFIEESGTPGSPQEPSLEDYVNFGK
jgi:hypothetical protein